MILYVLLMFLLDKRKRKIKLAQGHKQSAIESLCRTARANYSFNIAVASQHSPDGRHSWLKNTSQVALSLISRASKFWLFDFILLSQSQSIVFIYENTCLTNTQTSQRYSCISRSKCKIRRSKSRRFLEFLSQRNSDLVRTGCWLSKELLAYKI